jgi:two-component system, NtrC family, response regulator
MKSFIDPRRGPLRWVVPRYCPMPTGNLLLIDDETRLRQVLARVLELEGYTVAQAPDAARGLAWLIDHAAEVDVVLSDVKLPDGSGVALLPRYRAAAPGAEVVLLTAFGNVPDSVRAMKAGAFDYLTKGDSDDQLLVVVERAVEKARLQRRVTELETRASQQLGGGLAALVGESAALAQAKSLAERVAPTEATVLLTGETGAGKELFAQAIHQGSRRRGKAFVAVNCSAFPKELLESELFGYRKGAFTGALTDKKGLFDEASGGTLFLDEVGELAPEAQAKLLRVLETQTFTRLGDTKPTRVDVRLVAATNRDLKAEADGGGFRLDLYYRLSGFSITVPPLRARAADVPALARQFLSVFAAKLKKRLPGLSEECLQRLSRYPWPGNVRELKNVLERAAILALDGQELTSEDLPPEFQTGPAALAARLTQPVGTDPAFDLTLRAVEARHIGLVLTEMAGNKTETARKLGIGLTTLYRKMQEYGLET